MADSSQPFDLITIGRTGVDLSPLPSGVPLGDVQKFGKFPGGSAAGVSVAAARLGRSAAVITHAVDASFAIRAARILWITGTGLGEEPSRSATLAALKARGKAGTTVLHLDRKPALAHDTARKDPEDARQCHAEALRHATVAVGDLDACETVTGIGEARACADALLAAGVELAVVKQGTKGVLAVHRDGTTAEVPPVPIEAVNGLGADDAFGGALCHGLLSGWELERIIRYADAAGALVASRPADSSTMPTPEEVEGLLNGAPS
ncbi:PfkB family carbohydrate kinase [Streptomyces sp. NPDC046909]|uniref:PfkB family carbohydrate kinase n=1 Tax=Streptomyces sp. NPDC046909 TaxID=3155617 RepID=UPI0033C36F41